MTRWLCCSFVVGCCLLGLTARGGDEEPAAEVLVETAIDSADREHWSFAPLVRPAIAHVPDGQAAATPVDAFIGRALAARELSLAPRASAAVLLRRLSFDLVGLPPTPMQLAEFLADDSPAAYARLVDRLLASPAYGERWAQHWLDLAGFAETDGFEHDKVRPQAWKYRDWVIDAVNADLPYDRFVALQIDGDELAEGQDAVATMFCLCGPDMPDINDQALRRHNLLNGLTAKVGAALLGLQLGCAECHDHKYDPLSQADFYRLRAAFESAVPVLKRDVPYNFLSIQKISPPARLWIRGDHRRPGPEVQPGFPRIACGEDAPSAEGAGDRSPRARFTRWLFDPQNPLVARAIVNRIWHHHFGRPLADQPSDLGTLNPGPSHPELLDFLACELRDAGWSLKYLHRMIVLSDTYCQSSYAQPAADAPTSAAWAEKLARDPTGQWYSRFPRCRLDGEELRDAMLAAAGLLHGERGGPGVLPPLPPELVSALLKDQWQTSPREADHYRRSIYVFARRNLRYPLFEAFDRPDASGSCPQRNQSITATQSLTLLNGDLSLLAARHLAGRLMGEAQSGPARIARLYQLALARNPALQEVQAIESFLVDQEGRLAAEGRGEDSLVLPARAPPIENPRAAAALVDACLAILNCSEFVTVD